jgi:hypothetical protein
MWKMVRESRRFSCEWVISLGLMLIILTIGGARAELLQWSLKPDFATCQKTDDAVWAEYAGGQDCIRFFSGGTIKDAPVVIVLLRGDTVGWVKRKPADIPDNTVEAQKGRAERTAQVIDVPVIVLERPGTFGSTGNHLRRRQAPEFLALNSALDAIKQRCNCGCSFAHPWAQRCFLRGIDVRCVRSSGTRADVACRIRAEATARA